MTPEPISDERLVEIQERTEAATVGPWMTGDWIRDRVMSEHIDRWQDDDGTTYECALFVCDTDSGMEEVQPGPEQDEANAEFIAHARTDVPDLLAEVVRLRASLTASEARIEAGLAWARQANPDMARNGDLFRELRVALGGVSR